MGLHCAWRRAIREMDGVALMNTLLISTFISIPMFVMGFWLARMIYLPQVHKAEQNGLVIHLDPQDAARRVS
jgi:hypothetical protein